MKQRIYTVKPYRAKDGWRLRLKAGNGKIPGFEAYASRGNCVRAGRRLATAVLVVVVK